MTKILNRYFLTNLLKLTNICSLTGTGCGTCSSTSRCGLGGCGGTFLSGAADRVVPESAIPASGKKGRLWRRFYYLQYLKLLYNRLKKEYAR